MHELQHFLVAREHRKEKRRKVKGAKEEPEPVIEGDEVDESNQDRGHLISYCSLDYQRFYDMARFRMHRMRQTLKSELEDRQAFSGTGFLAPHIWHKSWVSCVQIYTQDTQLFKLAL